MKRRDALQNLAAATAAILFVPSCTVEENIPSFANIPLEKGEYRLVEAVIKAILPSKSQAELADNSTLPSITTPETPENFALTMINDCYSPEDIRRYLRGLRLFSQYVQDEHERGFEQLNEYQHVLMFTEMVESKTFPKSLRYFLQTTKQLAVRHLTSSEYFLTQKLDWEFIPGRYIGCKPA